MYRARPAWGATHLGRIRKANEDGCLVGDWRSEGAVVSWRGSLPADRRWAVVADGMGGHDAGDVASRTALDTIAEHIGAVSNRSEIQQLLDRANDSVFEAMFDGIGKPAMGTTVVGAVLSGEDAIVFNLGDSRAYLMGRDGLVQLSVDDTLGVADGRPGERSHGLTQCLGGTTTRRPIWPHIKRVPLASADVLLFCSDGLTDMLEDNEIGGVLARHPTNPAEELAAAALAAGGRDNVTVVVIGAEKELGVG